VAAELAARLSTEMGLVGPSGAMKRSFHAHWRTSSTIHNYSVGRDTASALTDSFLETGWHRETSLFCSSSNKETERAN
jgi:hypothetical protein